MAGQKIVLSGVTFTDTTLPIMQNDPVLSTGSLFLMDFSHSMGLVSGVPANLASIPNVAASQAAALTGVPAILLNGSFEITATGTDAIIERSGKLGLHAIMSQANDSLGRHIAGKLPAALCDYIIANKNHSFYVSLWERITRISTSASNTVKGGLWAGNTSLAIAGLRGDNQSYPNPNQYFSMIGAGGINVQAAGIQKSAMASNSPVGTFNSGALQANATLFCVGGYGAWAGLGLHAQKSSIIYRTYIEDLTVSGRTPAQVDAIETALYNQFFGAGGKWASDTYTVPSSFP